MVTHQKYVESPLQAYQGGLQDLSDGTVTVRVGLMTDTFTIDTQADSVWTDVNADEIDPATNTGYTAGGKEIVNKTVTQDGQVVRFDGDNVVWSSSSINAYYAVVYVDDSNTGSSYLLTVVDFEGEEISSNGDFTIEWDTTNGIFEVQVQTP
jgi:hypothetical protein